MIKVIAAFVLLSVSTVSAAAQEHFWVQVEAQTALTSAQTRAREYASTLDDVHGFYLGDGFYGIFIGPYTESNAETALETLLRLRVIPSDSFVKDGRRFQQQYWPVGGRAPEPAQLPGTPSETVDPVTQIAAPTPPAAPSGETVAEARASESALDRPAKEELQVALRWAGHYNAAIDGSFGRGTRAAMQAWQAANNEEPTGVLTTRQRAKLFEQYNSVLEGTDLRLVRDDASGIQMQIPTGLVAFTEYKPPFVRFDPSVAEPQAQVLFISQSGDAGRLVGLYEIMQVLDIVPTEGPRNLTSTGFEIEGISDELHSYTSVSLEGNDIKGFTLVWPAGDDARRTRVLDIMKASFERLDGTLDPAIVPPGEDQSIDLVSGLTVRQPTLSRSGFYVSQDGVVATTPEVIAQCDRITIDRETDAEVIASDAELGVALLRPTTEIAPHGLAAFQTTTPRLQDQVVVGGYPYDGVLSAPTLTFGQVIDIRSLTGDDRLGRLSILPQPSDAGGPVFNKSGAVIGMLLPRIDGNSQVLPAEVNFSLDATQIVALMETHAIPATMSDTVAEISPVQMTRNAADITVLVSCW
ncbi:peptidoglycan-binding protein [Loktanella sp. D2R18]|uniref:trypsin-like peptidase domain-containing protein n=1 Tax=Rhodobacterales TaxID=204455 RepID=UPI000DE966F3|nr:MULTISPECIES: trypsin-like peptidase domain-containing protein [Rhodobacterales]MDO6589057.1 trypsin-like peptidase domain-containing protein [Yoonia sp. 1_MG-2023]RBW45503.1 peptidoglycan-binding protein [Loktanella sp. D2R18]